MLSPIEIATLAAVAEEHRTIAEVARSLEREGMGDPEQVERAMSWLHHNGYVFYSSLGRPPVYRPTALGETELARERRAELGLAIAEER